MEPVRGDVVRKPSDRSAISQALFGVGQIAGQIFRDAPSLLLLFFMTNTLGVEAAIAGVAIFLPKFFWGAACDLGVGIVSDRLSHRIPRRAWLLLGAFLSPFAMILLFHVPDGAPNAQALYIGLAFSLYMLVFALFSVPYLAIGAEFSSDPHGRTTVMAWRLVFTAFGILIASSAGPNLLQRWGGGEAAYRQLALALAVVCAVSLLVAYAAVGIAPRRPTASGGQSSRALLRAIAAPRFVGLLGPVLLQLVGSGLSYAAMLYFLTYTLGRSDGFVQLGLIVLIMTLGIIAAQPMWLMLSRRFGKPAIYLTSTLGYGLSLAVWGGFSSATPIEFSYAVAAMLAVCNSGWSLMSFSMLGDVIADDAAESGYDRGGLFSSVWVAADKIGFALGGTLLIGLILSASGFSAASAVSGGQQAQSAMQGIAVAFGFAPAALNLVAFLWFSAAQRAAKGQARQDS